MECTKRLPDDPTPQEIRKMTLKIRESWDDRTYLLRISSSNSTNQKVEQPKWEPPVVPIAEIERGLGHRIDMLIEDFD